ncbi:response regulator transcription factor [Bacillus niameyensis]|uniref:response regulator transcription factor n=1 Tax=Bacillus niameyensis TaxID=1522308 RepID=UPI0007807D1A|nr:response regulator [Bacillus niameyensis]
MFNLLIVDDEPIIVDGLIQLFSDVDMELDLFSAYSAKQALDYALQKKVDIVITDMKMPETNGLQFVDELQLIWPKCRVIFLSGYDQFEYVYDAVKRNIDSYVLKTEDDQVLINAVQKSIQKIEEERSVQASLEANRKWMEEITPLLKKEFLKLVLDGESMENLCQSYSQIKSSFEIDLEEQWLLVAGELKYNKAPSFQDLLLLHETMKQELHPNLLLEYCIYQHLVIWFIQPQKIEGIFYGNKTVKWETIREYSKRLLESIQESYSRKMNRKVNFVIGKRPVNINLVNKDFQQMLDILKFLSSFSEGMIIIDQSKTNPFYHLESVVFDDKEWKKQLIKLETAISEGREQQALKIIDGLFDQMINNEYSNIEMTDFLFSISKLILGFLRNKGLYQEVVKRQEDSIQKRLQKFPVLFDSKESIVYMINTICHYKAEWKEEGKRKIILTVNNYIQNNLAGDISLTAIADHVHFNPSYLSRFYKEQTGKNLSDVIDELRMKQATYYLNHTEMAIQKIAMMLGFNSPSYFNFYFKKRTQQSPQEYREKRRT